MCDNSYLLTTFSLKCPPSAAWSNNLLDTDKIIPFIAKDCAASSACPLYESTPEAVEDRIYSILSKLKTNPLPVVNGADYGVADFDMAWRTLFRILYSPYKNFPPFASALVDVEKGDGKALYALTKSPDVSFQCHCGDEDAVRPEVQVMETTTAIACGDGEDISGETLKDLEKFYEEMTHISVFANFWTRIHTGCMYVMKKSRCFSLFANLSRPGDGEFARLKDTLDNSEGTRASLCC